MSTNLFDFWIARGFIEAITNNDICQKASATPIKGYIGFDPTADCLHIGNLVGIVALRWMQIYGHKPIILMGGATGRIGDPSGKSAERPLLSEEAIENNIQKISQIFEKFLDFTDEKTRPLILNNHDWLGKYSFLEFLRDVGKHFRIGPMLAKESVRSRVNSDEGMSFTEFSYQTLQGYDFFYLYKNYGVTLQLGGSDQWGNITAGIEFTRKLAKAQVYGLTFPLLTRIDGKKFGKSEEGAIWLDEKITSAYKFYQYFIRVPDADVIKLLRFLTFLDNPEIDEIQRAMDASQYEPFTAQKKLAEELTLLVHGQKGLEKARRATEIMSPGHCETDLTVDSLEAIKDDMPSTVLEKIQIVDKKFTEVAVIAGFLSSKSEAVRLIKNGGAYVNNQKIDDTNFALRALHLIGGKYCVLGAGKKRKQLLIVQQ